MAFGCGAKFSKFILILFNVLFWISGLILIIMGSIYVTYGSLKYFEEVISPNDKYLTRLMFVIIGIGCLVFIIGFCGCCGAIKESQVLLGIYIGLLLFIMVAEISCGIYVIVKKSEVLEKVEKSLENSIQKNYPQDTSPTHNQNLKNAVDYLQMSFECCGVTKYDDWTKSVWYANRSDLYKETPVSCCKSTTEKETRSCFNEQKYFRNGCSEKLIKYVKSKFPIFIGILIGIPLFEILVVLFAFCLCKNTGDAEHSTI